MSQHVRLGNVYRHTGRGWDVLAIHRDHKNQVWYRRVISEDNGGVLQTGEEVYREPYGDFLGTVEMYDYPPDEEWQGLRQAVLERDRQTCQGCGTDVADDAQANIHHIVPLGCGGTNSLRNLITLCEDCHGRTHGGPI